MSGSPLARRLLALVMSSLVSCLLAGVVQAQTVAVTGGKVFPVSGPPIENGTVVIVEGTITAVGAGVTIPPSAVRIDATGKWVTPGMINASTQLGLIEVDMVTESDDATARGERGVAAAFRAWEALNSASVLWTPLRNDGITHVGVLPSGGLIGGQGALVETLEGPLDTMVRKAPVAMLASFPATAAADTRARAESLQRLRELLVDARTYAQRRTAYDTNALRSLAASRLQLAALGRVLARELPLAVRVDRAADILAMVGLAQEFALRLVIVGGAEAWKVADRLAAAKVPVFAAGLDNLPTAFGELGARMENAALLRAAGVPLVLTAGDANNFRAWTVRQHAGNAVAAGLPWAEALRAVTLGPAEAFGLSDRIGSLQPGREGTLVVWDGDPFEVMTRAAHVLVRGRDARGRSRQDLLTERYRRQATEARP